MENFAILAASLPTMAASSFWFGTSQELILAGAVCFCLYHLIQRFSLKDPWSKIAVFSITAVLSLPVGLFVLNGISTPFWGTVYLDVLPVRVIPAENPGSSTGENCFLIGDQKSESCACRFAEFKNHTLIDVGLIDKAAKSKPEPQIPPLVGTFDLKSPVVVQVIIDTSGEVVSVCATSGESHLRKAAENAARKARFLPTNIDGPPIYIKGLLTYKFTPQPSMAKGSKAS